VADLDERLLAATGPLPRGRVLHESDVNGPRAALRAVIALHAPVRQPIGGGFVAVVCKGCDQGLYVEPAPLWPCSTIQVIARELEVDGGE
jgi:hypothetical protein